MEDVGLWRILGSSIISYYADKSSTFSVKTYKSYFKLTPRLTEILWQKLVASHPGSQRKHLLWTLHYLKTEANSDVEIASLLNTNRETLMIALRQTVRNLFRALPEVLKHLHIYLYLSLFSL